MAVSTNAHVRTRRSHTDEVEALAVAIARILGLNVELCRAIARGHDIGHTPYGHVGEQTLSRITSRTFSHAIFGAVDAEHIERKGEGLHLTEQTLQGIICHDAHPSTYPQGAPLEYHVVYWSDKFCWVSADLNDIRRNSAGYFDIDAMNDLASLLGNIQREIVDTLQYALVLESSERGTVSFEYSETAQRFEHLKEWLCKNVYKRLDWSFHITHIEFVYDFFSRCPELEGCDPAIVIGLMTDGEMNHIAVTRLSNLTPTFDCTKGFSIHEITPYIRGRAIDFANPGLSS